MTIALVSFFRNCGWNGQVARFFTQAAQLRNVLARTDAKLRVICVHGDCTDDTVPHIMRNAEFHDLAVQLVECNHGGPMYGSTEAPERLKALSQIGNAGLGSIRDTDDYVVYVESDLIWDGATIVRLLNRVSDEAHVVAPLIFAGEYFYDVFCFRKNGQRFAPFPPYHSELNHGGSLTQVDSVGSCLVMPGKVARECRIIEDNVLLGFCKDVWSKGYTVNVDASQKVVHP
jgi:hypothetical protein